MYISSPLSWLFALSSSTHRFGTIILVLGPVLKHRASAAHCKVKAKRPLYLNIHIGIQGRRKETRYQSDPCCSHPQEQTNGCYLNREIICQYGGDWEKGTDLVCCWWYEENFSLKLHSVLLWSSCDSSFIPIISSLWNFPYSCHHYTIHTYNPFSDDDLGYWGSNWLPRWWMACISRKPVVIYYHFSRHFTWCLCVSCIIFVPCYVIFTRHTYIHVLLEELFHYSFCNTVIPNVKVHQWLLSDSNAWSHQQQQQPFLGLCRVPPIKMKQGCFGSVSMMDS